jgi:hypothetical protein
MKHNRTAVLPAVIAIAALAGCASKPPAELRDARDAYQRATKTTGAHLVQTDIYEAKKALGRAEQRFEDEGDEAETRDVAYVARAKAELARANAEAVMAQATTRMAEAETQNLQDQKLQRETARMEAMLEQ